MGEWATYDSADPIVAQVAKGHHHVLGSNVTGLSSGRSGQEALDIMSAMDLLPCITAAVDIQVFAINLGASYAGLEGKLRQRVVGIEVEISGV